MTDQLLQTKTAPRTQVGFLVGLTIGVLGIAVGLAVVATRPKSTSPVTPVTMVNTNTSTVTQTTTLTGVGVDTASAQADLIAKVRSNIALPNTVREDILNTSLNKQVEEVVAEATLAAQSGDPEKINIGYPYKCSCNPSIKALCISGQAKKCSNSGNPCTNDWDCGTGNCSGNGYACTTELDCPAPQNCRTPSCSGSGTSVCLGGRVSGDSISLNLTIMF